jgi:hypothetical protein
VSTIRRRRRTGARPLRYPIRRSSALPGTGAGRLAPSSGRGGGMVRPTGSEPGGPAASSTAFSSPRPTDRGPGHHCLGCGGLRGRPRRTGVAPATVHDRHRPHRPARGPRPGAVGLLGKGRKERGIAIDNGAVEALERYLPGPPAPVSSGSRLPGAHDLVRPRQAAAVRRQPPRRRTWVDREPICVHTSPPAVLGRVPDDVLQEDGFRYDPAMCVKRRNPETHCVLVVLVAKLLKTVDASLPKRRKLYFHAPTCNDAVRLNIFTEHNVQTIVRAPASHELLPDLAHSPRGKCTYPLERAPSPGVDPPRPNVVSFQIVRDRRQHTDLRVRYSVSHESTSA